mmetsp:Transcript_65005/g.184416  ORF Transcript_65005/g.184416 Transcript_65005/m.184416 type:complete len:276 (+) Transcript_65005:539-1366(+)
MFCCLPAGVGGVADPEIRPDHWAADPEYPVHECADLPAKQRGFPGDPPRDPRGRRRAGGLQDQPPARAAAAGHGRPEEEGLDELRGHRVPRWRHRALPVERGSLQDQGCCQALPRAHQLDRPQRRHLRPDPDAAASHGGAALRQGLHRGHAGLPAVPRHGAADGGQQHHDHLLQLAHAAAPEQLRARPLPRKHPDALHLWQLPGHALLRPDPLLRLRRGAGPGLHGCPGRRALRQGRPRGRAPRRRRGPRDEENHSGEERGGPPPGPGASRRSRP